MEAYFPYIGKLDEVSEQVRETIPAPVVGISFLGANFEFQAVTQLTPICLGWENHPEMHQGTRTGNSTVGALLQDPLRGLYEQPCLGAREDCQCKPITVYLYAVSQNAGDFLTKADTGHVQDGANYMCRFWPMQVQTTKPTRLCVGFHFCSCNEVKNQVCS
jgi:hypothetical protein